MYNANFYMLQRERGGRNGMILHCVNEGAKAGTVDAQCHCCGCHDG